MSGQGAKGTAPLSRPPTGKLSRAGSILRWPQRLTGWDIVRLCLGLLLLVAALLKWQQLLTESSFQHSIFASGWSLSLLLVCELFLAIWLLVGFWPHVALRSALVCFSLFAGVSFWQAASGQVTCNCFGKLRVDPWYTFLLDLGAIGGLLAVGVREIEPVRLTCSCRVEAGGRARTAPARGLRRLGELVMWALLGVGFGLLMPALGTPYGDPNSGVVPDHAVMVVAPSEQWVGRPFPLLRYVDVGEQLRRGQWWVVLVRHGCPRCDDLLEDLVERAEGLGVEPGRSSLAIIELPPYGLSARLSGLRLKGLLSGKLTDRFQWLVGTPLIFRLRNGTTVQFSSDPRVLPLLRRGANRGDGDSPTAFPQSGGQLRYACLAARPWLGWGRRPVLSYISEGRSFQGARVLEGTL